MKTGQKISKSVQKVFFCVKSTHKPYTVIGQPLGVLLGTGAPGRFERPKSQKRGVLVVCVAISSYDIDVLILRLA